jgi:hypothetical protein
MQTSFFKEKVRFPACENKWNFIMFHENISYYTQTKKHLNISLKLTHHCHGYYRVFFFNLHDKKRILDYLW